MQRIKEFICKIFGHKYKRVVSVVYRYRVYVCERCGHIYWERI